MGIMKPDAATLKADIFTHNPHHHDLDTAREAYSSAHCTSNGPQYTQTLTCLRTMTVLQTLKSPPMSSDSTSTSLAFSVGDIRTISR